MGMLFVIECVETNMDFKAIKLAQRLSHFLTNKHYPYAENVCGTSFDAEQNYSSSESIKNVGIAVYMLSYTFRLEYRKSFLRIHSKFKKYIFAYMMKFSEIYFKEPNHFKILVIFSFISEILLLSYAKNCYGIYQNALATALVPILRNVCFDYICKNGGWKAVEEVAKKVAEGYKILQPVIDAETPNAMSPIMKTLQRSVAVKNLSVSEETKKTEHEQIEEFEDYLFANSDIDERVSVGNSKFTFNENNYERTDNSACNKNSDLPSNSFYKTEYSNPELYDVILFPLFISTDNQKPGHEREKCRETKTPCEQQYKESSESDLFSVQNSTKISSEPYVPEKVASHKKKHKTNKQKKRGKKR